MPIRATPRFSGSSLRKVSGAWTARESWVVTGTGDKNAAIEAAVRFDTPHGLNPNMRAGQRDAENFKGPLTWIVTADFTFGDHGVCAGSPLDEPPKIMGEVGFEVVPSDVDILQQPIVNSAGDPYEPALPSDVQIFTLSVRKAMPFYSIQTALAISDHVNSDSFFLRGAGGVDPGQCHCRHMKPAEWYTENAPYVWVDFCFEFAGGPDPWQINVVDKGRNGFYGDGAATHRGQFCDTLGRVLDKDTLLDGTGKPIDSSIHVLDGGGAIHAAVSKAVPAGVHPVAGLSSTTQTTLIWKNKYAAAFAGLL